MATNKFKPKASSNIIEGANPVDTEEIIDSVEAGDTNVPEVKDDNTPVEQTPVKEEAKDNKDVADDTVKFSDKDSKTPIEKNVKICTKVNHSCTIGGVRYHFEKGKQVNVPASVKSVLKQADLLMPL